MSESSNQVANISTAGLTTPLANAITAIKSTLASASEVSTANAAAEALVYVVAKLLDMKARAVVTFPTE